jgi:beta-galactosidase
MKNFSLPTLIAIIITLSAGESTIGQVSPRSSESFNQGWKFVKYFDEAVTSDSEPENLQLPSINDNNWRSLDLPHDWAIEGPFSDTLENNTGLLPWKGIGWYRKHFVVSDTDKDKRIYITFDGAMVNAKVWLNGRNVGEWPYGYTSFQLDLTPYIITGKENIIAVRLDTKNWDSRWYPGAGLFI